MEPLSFTIDCRELVSRAAAHDCFARVFSLPAGYGRNLDALYDVLTSLPPCRITLAGTSCLYPLLGAYAEKLLAEIAAENEAKAAEAQKNDETDKKPENIAFLPEITIDDFAKVDLRAREITASAASALR